MAKLLCHFDKNFPLKHVNDLLRTHYLVFASCGIRSIFRTNHPYGHWLHSMYVKIASPLAEAVAVKIKQIFDCLSVRSLPSCCVDGFTQNATESYNNVLCCLCPKVSFVGAVPINTCASLSVVIYNDGYSKLKLVLDELSIDIGQYTKGALQNKDDLRLYQRKRKLSEEEKRIRMAHRKRKWKEEDRFLEQEGTLYEAGGF